MTKLSDITGYAENFPKKREVYQPTDEQYGNGASYDLREIKGHNALHDQTSSLGIGIDEEMLAKLWFENYFDDQWEDCSGIERALILQVAKALARQSHKFLRIEKE